MILCNFSNVTSPRSAASAVAAFSARHLRQKSLTWWHIIIRLYGDVLRDLKLVYSLQYRDSLADGGHAELLQALGIEHNQHIPSDVVLCRPVSGRLWSIQAAARTSDLLLVLGKPDGLEPCLHVVLVPLQNFLVVFNAVHCSSRRRRGRGRRGRRRARIRDERRK